MKRSFYKKFVSSTKKALEDAVVIEVKGKIIANKLNIRQKPSLNANVVGTLRRGDIVNIFNVIEDWYQIVTTSKKTAYVFKKYVEIVRQEKSGRIVANVLNIRSMPNTEGEILGKLRRGSIVNILKEYSEWIKIEYKEREAYIYKKFVEISDVPLVVNPSNTPTAVPGNYFYKRKDLLSIKLEPRKLIEVTGNYHEKIAARTWNNYGGLISKISDELKIDVATGLSVLCVESSGKGYKDDKMIIRFENHVMDMFWGKHNEKLFAEHFKYNKKSRRNGHYYRLTKKDDWQPCHTSQDVEWEVLNLAKSFDDTAALKSISMGAPQVMGFNHKFIGYASPQEMFSNFNKDIRFHLLALFDFCIYKPERVRYLQKRDFYSFAREYNGSADPKAYEKRFLLYYDIFKKILR